MEIIRCKTALLFQAAAHTAGVLASDDPDAIAALRSFGLNFGLAYQLVDDWLDYAGDSHLMGKNPGDDLAEGKLTLPLIHALANGTRQDSATLREALQAKNADGLNDVLCVVRESGALGYTRARAEHFSRLALDALAVLPDNDYRQALTELVSLAVARLQ
jgi:octaprenyl-diphosphate synthase